MTSRRQSRGKLSTYIFPECSMPRCRALISNLYPLDVCSETIMMKSLKTHSLPFLLDLADETVPTSENISQISSSPPLSLIPPPLLLLPMPLLSTHSWRLILLLQWILLAQLLVPQRISMLIQHVRYPQQLRSRPLLVDTQQHRLERRASASSGTCVLDMRINQIGIIFCCWGIIEWRTICKTRSEASSQHFRFVLFGVLPPKLSTVYPLASTWKILAVETWQRLSPGWNLTRRRDGPEGMRCSICLSLKFTTLLPKSVSDSYDHACRSTPRSLTKCQRELLQAYVNGIEARSPQSSSTFKPNSDKTGTHKEDTDRSMTCSHPLPSGDRMFSSWQNTLIGIRIFIDMSSQSYWHIHLPLMPY